jgi:hypothetical protein
MAGFKRRFLQDPGADVLLNTPSVNILDLPPPSPIQGAGVGVACLVAEFEDGAFNKPTEVSNSVDLERTFGAFGFTRATGPYRDPVARRTGGTELWNGNGWIGLFGKTFSRLVIVRVDNRAGTVELRRLAAIAGGEGPYNLEPGETLIVNVDGAPDSGGTVTIAAAAAVKAGSQNIAALQVWQVDATPGPDVFVDQTAGFNDATVANWTIFPAAEAVGDYAAIGASQRFNRVVFDSAGGTPGVGGVVTWEYWNGSAWTALAGVADATTGFTAAASDGQELTFTIPTDWAQTTLNSVAAYYIRARITTIYGTNPIYDQGFISGVYAAPPAGSTLEIRVGTTLENGTTRVITFAGGELIAAAVTLINNVIGAPASTPVAVNNAGALDLQSIVRGSGGRVEVVGGTAVVYLGQTTGSATGTGDAFDIDATTQAEIIALANGVLADSELDTDGDGNLRVRNTATPLTGTVEIDATSTMAAGLGLETGLEVAANDNASVTIPAGTVFTNGAGSRWLALQTMTVRADGTVITMPVRPATDDDTEPSVALNTVTSFETAMVEAFAVTNPAALVRMNAAQLDLAYQNAIDATIDMNGVSRDINILVSGRQSTIIRRAVRQNVVQASANGHNGRKGIVRPPIGTARADAMANTGVGVGVNRDQRVTYMFPGWSIQVPQIAAVGELDGGVGFTDDGVIDVGSDTWMMSVRSILPPEQDAGQKLSDTNVGSLNVLALEDAYNSDESGIGLTMEDYIAFEAAGVCAPRVDRDSGALAAHSDVTSVNPLIDSSLVPNLRRYMADFIQDSLSAFGNGQVKKLSTFLRRLAIQNQTQNFLGTLRSADVPESSRIEAFSVDAQSGNTQALLDRGLYVLVTKVKLYQIIKSLVFRTEIGPTVTVTEAA